jgi:hypothetical protein
MKAPDDIAKEMPTILKAGLLASPTERLCPLAPELALALALADSEIDDDIAGAGLNHVYMHRAM